MDTWQFEAKHFKNGFHKNGTLSFLEDKTLVDPDKLYQDYVAGWPGKVRARVWGIEVDSTGTYIGFGKMVWVRLHARDKDSITHYVAGHYYQIKANQCNRVHLIHPSKDLEIVLTR